MSGKKIKVIMKASEPGIIVIDGVKYIAERETFKKIDKVEHSDAIIFKKFDEAEYNKDIELLVDTFSDFTTIEEMLRELLKGASNSHIRRVAKRIRLKQPVKKQEGCLGFKVGDTHVQLIE